MTREDLQIKTVLTAKCKLVAIAYEMLGKSKSGEAIDKCCVSKLLFLQRLNRKIECYEIGGENNCWTESQWMDSIAILNTLLK